jgi:hypothetical protein
MKNLLSLLLLFSYLLLPGIAQSQAPNIPQTDQVPDAVLQVAKCIALIDFSMTLVNVDLGQEHGTERELALQARVVELLKAKEALISLAERTIEPKYYLVIKEASIQMKVVLFSSYPAMSPQDLQEFGHELSQAVGKCQSVNTQKASL